MCVNEHHYPTIDRQLSNVHLSGVSFALSISPVGNLNSKRRGLGYMTQSKNLSSSETLFLHAL